MKKAYRMFKRNDRGGVYYIQENGKNNAVSLRTTDEAEAQRLLETKNHAVCQTAALNLKIGKAFITSADPKMAVRTWKVAMDELSTHGKEVTQKRYSRELKSKALGLIRDKVIVETNAEDLKAVLKRGGAFTNNYLRRLHNLALENGWIHYQWQKDGTNLVESYHFIGVTNSTLTISNAQPEDAGDYIVIANNPSNSTPTIDAYLYVFKPIQLGLTQSPSVGSYQLLVNNQDGSPLDNNEVSNFVIYTTTNLSFSLSNWDVATNTGVISNGIYQVVFPDDGSMARFWQIGQQP